VVNTTGGNIFGRIHSANIDKSPMYGDFAVQSIANDCFRTNSKAPIRFVGSFVPFRVPNNTDKEAPYPDDIPYRIRVLIGVLITPPFITCPFVSFIRFDSFGFVS
jgi:hypothetical protein